MRAPQSSSTSLLSWLTVVVFLMAGLPAPQPGIAASGTDSQRSLNASRALADEGTSLEAAQPGERLLFRLLKARDLLDAPLFLCLVTPGFGPSREVFTPRAAPFAARRPSLVGTVELRV